MKKFILVLALIFTNLSAIAGQYEDALRTGMPVCLYLYTQTCKYCKQTKPVFEKMVQKYNKHCRFVSIDADSPYGSLLMQDMRIGYVPYIALADAKRNYYIPIMPTCAIESACMEKELKNFLK